VTAVAIRHGKLQSGRHHHKATPSFLQAGCPSYRPANTVKSTEGIPSSFLVAVKPS